MKFILAFALLFLYSSCHPLALFRPKAPPTRAVQAVTRSLTNISVAIDSLGIPFIKAGDLENAMYGLGYMHARDRLFQIDLMRHAALGRLSELFGAKTLSIDRKYRFLSYKLDEQMDRFSKEEISLLNAYSRGVNQGAAVQKRSAEHFLLGVSFEEFTPTHVLAIARLQSWHLASDLWAELYRLRIAYGDASLGAKSELIGAVDDHDSAIMRGNYAPYEPMSMFLPSYIKKSLRQNDEWMSFNNTPDPPVLGASNAWALKANIMKEQHAVLMNDPHLLHAWPSNFYLATIEAGDIKASGATFVGLPAILIGASPKLSWGVTASYLNTQDSVYLRLEGEDKMSYLVDGHEHRLISWPQRFCLNKKGRCVTEEHFTSIFGPVIDYRFDSSIKKGDKLAVMWTGFLIEEHRDLTQGFARLMAAPDVEKAVEEVRKITLPGVNLVLADTKGDIAYAYAGLVPNKDRKQYSYLPLDGAKSSSLWAGVLEEKDKPYAINPPEGFIVTANQNIFSRGAPDHYDYGKQGLAPYRALRIKERINELKSRPDPIAFDELSVIQMDGTSVEARQLAPTLGRLCEEHFGKARSSRLAFAKELKNFDGLYSTRSLAALPFEMMLNQIIKAKLSAVVGAKEAELPWSNAINYAIANALYHEINGQKTAIFTDKNGLSWQEQIKASCEPAYEAVVAKAGRAPWKWRWGRHHYIFRQSLLAQAPLFGSWFRDQKREVAGTFSSPLAEGGLPVRMGANLRMRVSMSSPPKINMILDCGNSGWPGYTNAFDQAKLWHKGETAVMETSFVQAKSNARLYFELEN